MKNPSPATLGAANANQRFGKLADDRLADMERMADEALARAELERQEEDRKKGIEQYLDRVEQAKKIKARRRRLGRNGFSTRRMAVPSAKVAHPTRRSV